MPGQGSPTAHLEHRLSTPAATTSDCDRAVDFALEHGLVAVAVPPWLVKRARRALGRSAIQLGTFVGFPHGGQLRSVKAFEASAALEQGATQVDFVMNAGALLSRDEHVVFDDVLAVVEMAHSALASAAAIVEAAPLGDDQIARACRLAERAGADYVVTSTGSASARTTISRARVMRETVGPRVMVKASGDLRSGDEIAAALRAGAERVSASLTAQLVAALREPATSGSAA
jgi:deoxyribose-phosphate aldolase